MKRFLNRKNEIFGMARIGYTDGKYEVYVNTNDAGNIPHFHYRLETDWSKFHTCIKLTSPEYFLHEGKEHVLNKKRLKLLMTFLLTAPPDRPGYTNWQEVVMEWNRNNSDMNVPSDLEMPDYNELM